MSSGVPTSLAAANRSAALEWLRTKIAAMPETDEPLRVLSAGAEDPEFDAEVARMLLARRSGLRYVVVSTHEGYTGLGAKYRDLAPALTVVPAAISDWDGAVPSAGATTGSTAGAATAGAGATGTGDAEPSAGSFELAILPLWDGPTTKLPAEEEAAEVLAVVTAHCAPGATVVAFRAGKHGAFRLRAHLHARLAQSSRKDGSVVDPDDLEPGATRLASALAGSGHHAWVERLDSQVDVSAAVGEELTVAGARLLRQLLGVDMEELSRQNPTLTETVIDELCDMTLAGDGFSGPVVVYTPLHAAIAVMAGSRRESAAAAAAGQAKAAAAKPSAAEGGLPGSATLVEQRAPPAVATRALFAASPALLVESDEQARQAAAQLLRTTGAGERAAEASGTGTDALYFYLRMRGDWGNFQGTGAGDVVAAAGEAADDAYAHGGGPTTVVPAGIKGPFAPVKAMLAVPHDPWFPHGLRGGFFNAGLRNWNEMRASWLSRPPQFVMPPYPPELDSEEVIEELAKLQRTYTLPGPMRLPDIIDLYLDIWDEELSGVM
ncbi:hypothetical protein FNF29_03159 [Cafeteria roenbergensis]|uniref:Uncharacterized protein n=1 Tax=Cafeteria roenbergensis TaxID=33653 RepID=A0A5A8CLK6_CAFRO|nr:hypothetical protein FNF29_03159 [Cafeteria roenbergensis]|eukprot:KAA0153344.1 hypothetical protein FNF29_03159 [Cafeteria roenbergensis]